MNDGNITFFFDAILLPENAGTRTDAIFFLRSVRSPLDVARRTIIIQGLTLTDQIVG